jgi:type VI secretion system protein ImpE
VATQAAQELYAAGRLADAIEALGVELRKNPDDAQRRVFLFELLSFAGQYDRADKQLDVVARLGSRVEAGTLVYRSALQAERIREHMFDTGDFPKSAAPVSVAGTCNGVAFSEISDADPRIGARLEVFAGGRYLWIPFAHLASVVVEPPAKLRDLRWLPAKISTGPSVKDMQLGDVLLPALTVGAWKQQDAELQLGRATDWEELADGDYAPVGQKVLRIDDNLVPLVDVRELTFSGGDIGN